MFRHYFKIAFRNFRKNPGYSFINMFGLTIGMYVRQEWSYDDFHKKGNRIYRLFNENRLAANLPPATPEDYHVWGSAEQHCAYQKCRKTVFRG